MLEALLKRGQQSPTQTILAVTAVLATAGIAAYSWMGSSAEATDLAPAVTEEEARKIMRAVYDRVKAMVPRLANAAQGIKQQIMEQGQEITDEQLMQAFILPHFETMLKEQTNEVLEEYDVDEDELEEAVSAYLKDGDDELTVISDALINIYKKFGGTHEDEEDSSKPTVDMPLEQLIEFLSELSEDMVESTATFVRGYVEQNGKPSSQHEVLQFQQQLMEVSDSVEKRLLAGVGLTTNDLQKLLSQHMNDAKVQQIFMFMQQQTQMIMQMHGIA